MIPLASPTEGEAAELLYASATTRVFRLESGGVRLACKQPLGADASRRLQHERGVLARLAGLDGVVQLASAFDHDRWLPLEECDAVPLGRQLSAGPLRMEVFLPMAILLARTLAAVHRAGVIHCDIHPANILIRTNGQPVLIDFDLSIQSHKQVVSTQGGQIAGTPAYRSPEQTARTRLGIDARSDLYSLGCTFYEMVCGKAPFESHDELTLIHDHLVHEPLPPAKRNPHVHPTLSRIILRLLAKGPQERYQSAEGLLHDLQRLHVEIDQPNAGIFTLGDRDFAMRLAAPTRLVGREAEITALRSALVDSIRTARHTVLVEGSPGVGKSALVNELRPVVAAAGGWFVLGKFDQYQKDGATGGALTQALRGLGRLLLAQSADEIAAQRQLILDGLGRSASLMTRLVPEFELLLGPQPDMAEADPQQAEIRLQQAIADLLRVIASPQRPLVLVLDDIQWAGGLSLRAIERLMNEPGIRGLLLVSAYRGNEIDPAHVLSPMLLRWNQQADTLTHLELRNLTPLGMSELIGQMLRLSHEQADALAEAVGALSGGNPFDTVEIVNTLRQEGILWIGPDGWQWDVDAIRHFVYQNSVLELLAQRVAKLPRSSQLLVEYMSCLGGSVEYGLLKVAAGLDTDALREDLRAPMDDGLLVPDANGQDVAHFRHDRVQQAVLGALDDLRRSQHQLEMARRLAEQSSLHEYAAQQYLGCVDRLREQAPDEVRHAARLFHSTAARLVGNANPALAERYLTAAATLLDALDGQPDAVLRWQIDVALHAVQFSLGRMEEADALHARVQAGMADPLLLVEPTCLQMRSIYMRGRMRDALDLGLDLLKRLGLKVPADFDDPTMEQRLDALGPWIQRQPQPDPLVRAPITDRHRLGVANVLSRCFSPAYFMVDRNALTWLTLECQRLWDEEGPCPELVVSLCRSSMMLVLTRNEYRIGYDIARYALAAGLAYGFEPQTSEGRHVFTISNSHWFETLEDTVVHAVRTREDLTQMGDITYACFTYFVTSQAFFEFERTLDTHAAEVATGMALCRRTGNNVSAMLIRYDQQLLRALRGETLGMGSFSDALFDEAAFIAGTAVPAIAKLTYHARRALSAGLFGDLPTLEHHSAAAIPFLNSSPGFYLSAHTHLLRALAQAWQLQARASDVPADSAALAELVRCRQWLQARAAGQPYNFLHLLRLVEAEEAWARGDMWRAMSCFDIAMKEAAARQRPWHLAFATERAAAFHLANEWTHTGGQLMTQARDMYADWGATAKVEQMQGVYPFLERTRQDSHARGSELAAPDSLGVMGVLRASQALSSETSLERLAARVTEVLAALSGATKVLVLSWQDDQWRLLSPAPSETSISLAAAVQRGLVPHSVVRYVERTQEPLVVDDAPHDDRFARDPYFAGLTVCTMMAAPIASQGSARALLLLENRLSRAAFNSQRLDAVMLIAGQLAVSLANAHLYESLEQRVKARTRELEQTQAQLVTTARLAGKAEIANNVLHNVGNVLNSVNVSASIVRRTVGSSRLQGLSRAVTLLNEHEGDIANFMSVDPRGKALITYLNEIVGVLDAERESILSDLDRLTQSVDHISYVVAMQQSHAGPSSVRQLAQPRELVDEALRLNHELLQRSAVQVIHRHDEVPDLQLDRQRLLQILVNLIANAVQAMESVPADARCITLSTGITTAGTGRRLFIAVRDAGEGIAAQNLSRIFQHGFTTRSGGHGFGLHSSALAAMEMGGKLTADSAGPGLGAVFTLDLPADAAVQ
ncbi:AAA family ATPase [Caenimonas koreensis]|uniref:trifunctional serine/threonine-protein kinase/ATP-binding protein/sensor histidine kinase n=1 Tax=Caenimonas koreensis TaxID=367474 RepID=UPI0037834C7F